MAVDWMTLGGNVVSVLMMVIGVLIMGSIMTAGTYIYLKWKRYNQFDCIIFQRDGFGQLCQRKDTAGIFVDKKTNNKRFYMRKANVGLNPDHIPYLSSPKGRKTVYFMQTGLKNFHFLKMGVDDKGLITSVGEEDVNWAINAYEKQKKIFSMSTLMQLLPFMALAFVSIIILIIFIYFFKEFDTLKEVAVALQRAAEQIASAKGGTTIIAG